MNDVNVEIIITRIREGYYSHNKDHLITILQLLIDIDIDSVLTYQIEKRLLEEVREETDNEMISFKNLISRINEMDQEFLSELKDYLPESSQNSYFQYILNIIYKNPVKDSNDVPEELNLDIELSLSDLFIFLYNNRRFGGDEGQKDVFLEAMINDDYHIFQAFVTNNEINLEVRNYYNDSLLHLAARHNSVQILGDLIQRKLNLNVQNDFNYTPAFTAYLNNRLEALQLLIDNGADLAIKNNAKLTVTEIAIIQDNLDVIEYILNHTDRKNNGINFDPYILALNFQAYSIFYYLNSIHYPMKAKQVEIFFTCCKKGQIDIISYYLDKGLSVNVCDKKRTPLLFTVMGEKMEATKYLLSRGADPNPKGQSPLLYAIKEGNIELVKLLIDYGANPFDQGKKMLTPLMTAVFYKHLDLVQYFIELGDDINRLGVKKLTPLAVAAEVGHYEIASYLIEKGAKFLPNGKSPLTIAIQFGSTHVLELLFRYGYYLDKTVIRPSELYMMIIQAKKFGNTSYLDQALTINLKDQYNKKVCDHTMDIFKKYQRKHSICAFIFLIFNVFFLCFAIPAIKGFYYYSNGTGRVTAQISQLNSIENKVYYTFEIDGETIQSYSTVDNKILKDLQVDEFIEIIYKNNHIEDTILVQQHFSLLLDLLIFSVATFVFLTFTLLVIYTIKSDQNYIHKRINELQIDINSSKNC